MKYLSILFSLFLLSACGGSSNNSPSFNVSEGVFLDSAVEGVRYVTATQSGLTNRNGSFKYLPGETVEFFIGDISLGSATGAPTLTPISFVSAATDETNPQVTNILRFVQSLDDDANPANGIRITLSTRSALAGQAIDFSRSISLFGDDFVALSLAVLGGVNLVSAADAQAHMRVTLASLVGGGGTGGNQGLGSLSISGADTAVIGSSFTPLNSFAIEGFTNVYNWDDITLVTPGNNAMSVNVNTDVGGAGSHLVQLLYLNAASPGTQYHYVLSCFSIPAECNKLIINESNKSITFNGFTLPETAASSEGNLATGSITINGTLVWQ